MKTKSDKKVNRSIRSLNKLLKNDVYGDRFELKMVAKNGVPCDRNYHWYIIVLMDNKYPERKRVIYKNESELLIGNAHFVEMNNFIVNSDFWPEYWRKKKEENLKEY